MPTVIVAVGVDTLEIARIERLLRRNRQRLLQRVCTAQEQQHCLQAARPAAAVAARFCAKEAVSKCLGSGFDGAVTLRSIEVQRAGSGAPEIVLHGAAAVLARQRGIRRIHVSLSHNEHTATAFAVAEG